MTLNTSTVGKALGTGVALLAWWNLSGTKATPTALRTLLQSEGLDQRITVPDIDPEAALRRAARSWSEGRGKAERWKAELVSSEAGTVTIGLLRFERPEQGKVGWVQHSAQSYDCNGRQWIHVGGTVFTDPDEHLALLDRINRFRDHANSLLTYLDHEWIRPHIVQAEMGRMKAFNLRAKGGVVVVPTAHEEDLQRLRRVVRQIGDSQLFIARAADDDDTRESIAHAAGASIGASVGDLKERIAKWRASSKKVRSDSAGSVLAEFAEIRNRAQLYASALRVSEEDLLGDLAEAETEARAILNGGQA